MTKNATPLAWIDSCDMEQIAWVNRYLWERLPLGYLMIFSTSDMAIFSNSKPKTIDAELILFINKMRSAWRQKKFRSKQNGKKTYSFVMSTEVEKKLKALAGHKGKIRQTLEALIVQHFESEVPEITKLKTKNQKLDSDLKEESKKLTNIQQVNHNLNQMIKSKDDELKRLKTELKQLKQDKANLLNEIKQLKEKHNNQFRTGDTKANRIMEDKTAYSKEENE